MSQISKDSEEMNTEINENTDTAQRSLKHKSVIGLILVIVLSVLSGLCADRYSADVTLRRNRIYEQQSADHALGQCVKHWHGKKTADRRSMAIFTDRRIL